MSGSIFVRGKKAESHAEIDLYVIDMHLKKKDQLIAATRIRLNEPPPKEVLKQTADVINDHICKFFGVAEASDKTLFRSIFFQNEIDRFFFCKKGDRLINKVVLSEGWQDFCTVPKAADFPSLIDNHSKLSVVTKMATSEKTQKLTFDDLSKVSDLPTVALYNCSGYQGYSECNKDLGWSRSIEKINLIPAAKL